MDTVTSDIYFDQNYGKLYEKADKGSAVIFNHESQYGKVMHQFIKRCIPAELLSDGEELYDIVTPYGYGGPLIVESEDGCRELLVRSFYEDFSQYCAEQKIVSEFVRFHPIAQNALDFKEVYQPIWDRNTLGTYLKSY